MSYDYDGRITFPRWALHHPGVRSAIDEDLYGEWKVVRGEKELERGSSYEVWDIDQPENSRYPNIEVSEDEEAFSFQGNRRNGSFEAIEKALHRHAIPFDASEYGAGVSSDHGNFDYGYRWSDGMSGLLRSHMDGGDIRLDAGQVKRLLDAQDYDGLRKVTEDFLERTQAPDQISKVCELPDQDHWIAVLRGCTLSGQLDTLMTVADGLNIEFIAEGRGQAMPWQERPEVDNDLMRGELLMSYVVGRLTRQSMPDLETFQLEMKRAGLGAFEPHLFEEVAERLHVFKKVDNENRYRNQFLDVDGFKMPSLEKVDETQQLIRAFSNKMRVQNLLGSGSVNHPKP